MATFNFELLELPAEAESLRGHVREFLRETLGEQAAHKRARSWGGFDREFSRKVGERGWIGMRWPKKYGGHERSALERYVVLEEMLAAGAPVSAHWVADRQSGPLLLRFGTEEQRERFLPRIARGELAFAIGMSEPDSGSDLASIRTRAEKAPGGYKVTGTKIWTSNAHISDYAIALFRTQVVPDKKHEGLTQFLVDLKSPGIGIRPIYDLSGGHHFNEVHFQECFVPDDMRVGDEGAGWKQVSTELAFERSGPERYLSSLQLLIETIREVGKEPGERAAVTIGRLVAHLATLRQMSLSVAGMLEAGQNPNLEAAVVKDVGTCFEQEIPEVIHALMGVEPRLDSGSQFERTLGYLVEHAPSFSLRGGTREILRGIIARGLGPPVTAMATNELRTILADTVNRLFTDRVTQEVRESAEKGVWPGALWQAVEESGLTLPQIPEERGGGGGTWQDAHIVVSAAGRFAVPLPIAETMVAAWLLSESGLDVPSGPLTIAPVQLIDRLKLARDGSGHKLSGTVTRVPWGRAAGHVVVVADRGEPGGEPMVALVLAGSARVDPDTNLALEPRDTLSWTGAPVVAAAPMGRSLPANAPWLYGALIRSAQMAGGLEYLLSQTVKYVSERKQFGRPLSAFQAIQQNLALLAGHTAAAGSAAATAFRAAEKGDAAFEVAVAKVRTGEAAGLGAGIAHQSHGAIGFTYEHSLHFVTRRLWSWRAEFGAEPYWAAELGRDVAARGADSLWSHVTSR